MPDPAERSVEVLRAERDTLEAACDDLSRQLVSVAAHVEELKAFEAEYRTTDQKA